jgi:hypothetical protein
MGFTAASQSNINLIILHFILSSDEVIGICFLMDKHPHVAFSSPHMPIHSKYAPQGNVMAIAQRLWQRLMCLVVLLIVQESRPRLALQSPVEDYKSHVHHKYGSAQNASLD